MELYASSSLLIGNLILAHALVRLRQFQAQDHATRSTQHETHRKLREAHQMLADVYNWFTEGFDTKDLQEAKATLQRLTQTTE
ncbi:MAG: hypothetical protein FJ147_25480 [Deltaproteobacteria bacterium]|nr:hypothetical protein [Deltaproteobacteria bacterium]